MFTTIAFSLTGGNLLKWFRDEWGYQEMQEAARTGSDPYDLLLEAIPNTPTNLMTLPYFTPSGTPYFETDVKGAIFGLSLSSTRGEVLRSLLEGVAFEMRLNLDIMSRSGIKIDELVAVGGGAKSKKWTQLKADVLNRPITTVAVTEAGCLGAAILARAGDTGEDIKSVANKWVQTTDVIEPNRDHSDVYDARFADYVRLYPALKKLSAERRGSDDPLPMSGRPGSQ
jgi:xylulokinase